MSNLYKYCADTAFITALDLAKDIENTINSDEDHLVCYESIDDGKAIMMCFEKYEVSLLSRSGIVSMTLLLKEISTGMEVTVVISGGHHDKLSAGNSFSGRINTLLSRYGFKSVS